MQELLLVDQDMVLVVVVVLVLLDLMDLVVEVVLVEMDLQMFMHTDQTIH